MFLLDSQGKQFVANSVWGHKRMQFLKIEIVIKVALVVPALKIFWTKVIAICLMI